MLCNEQEKSGASRLALSNKIQTSGGLMPDTIIGCRALRVAAPLLIHTQGVLRQVSQKITGKGGKAQLRFSAIIISDRHILLFLFQFDHEAHCVCFRGIPCKIDCT